MTQKLLASRWRWLIPFALIFVCGGVPLLLLLTMRQAVVSAADIFDTDVSNIPAPNIERFAYVDLPPSATNLQSHLSGFQDLFLRVRFDLPPEDLPEFLGSTRFQQPLTAGPVPDLIQDPFDRPWWKPLEAEQFQAGKTTFEPPTGGRLYQAILVDTTDPQRYIVYLMVFST